MMRISIVTGLIGFAQTLASYLWAPTKYPRVYIVAVHWLHNHRRALIRAREKAR